LPEKFTNNEVVLLAEKNIRESKFGGNKKYYFCKKPGHFRRTCRKWQAQINKKVGSQEKGSTENQKLKED